VLQALSSNIRREEGPVLLFELGRVYLPRTNDLRKSLSAVRCSGLCRADKRWHGRKEAVDFYDAKGMAESLLSELNVSYGFAPSQDAGLMAGLSGRSADWRQGCWRGGRTSPAVSQAFELPEQ
jgi:phenylalanyl-tRNA synthetase beta chain